MARIHSNEKLPPKEKTFKCDHCEKAFGTFRQAETHMERKHPEFKDEFTKKNLLFKCERGCDKVFNTSNRFYF